MATQKQPQGGSGNMVDPVMLLFGTAILGAFIFLFWSRFHTSIATGYSWLRVVQFAPFMVLGSVWSAAVGMLALAGGGFVFFKKKDHAKYGLLAALVGLFLICAYFIGAAFASWFVFFKDSDKSLIEWSHLSKSSLYANIFTFLVGVVPLAVWVVRRSLATNPTNHKHFAKEKDYTLHTFTDQMAEHYPHLALFRKLNLTEKSINKGKYRMADTEKQFAIKHDLLDRIKTNEYKVNRDRAALVFSEQMTRLWTGYAGLTKWELAVMAVLLPRIAATDPDMSDKDYKEALKRTDDLLFGYWRDSAKTYDKKKDTFALDLSLAKETIRKYGNSAKVKRFFKAHAYVGTILYAMLLEARTLGVLPPSELRWLRVVDRRLWLIIDNVGKIVSWTETGATYSHFLNEVKQKRAIERPMIDGAVRGLIEGVETYAFAPEEIEEIEKNIITKEQAALIDLQATAKEKRNMVLMLLTIGVAAKKDIFEAAVLSETGEVLYHQRCKSAAPIDFEVRERFLLSNDDVDGLSRLPTSEDVRGKLLEVCNGHHVITFDKKDIALVPGLDRSAGSVEECKGDSEFELSSTALMEGVIKEDEVIQIRDAVSAAQLCRALWVEQQKRALRAQTEQKARA